MPVASRWSSLPRRYTPFLPHATVHRITVAFSVLRHRPLPCSFATAQSPYLLVGGRLLVTPSSLAMSAPALPSRHCPRWEPSMLSSQVVACRRCCHGAPPSVPGPPVPKGCPRQPPTATSHRYAMVAHAALRIAFVGRHVRLRLAVLLGQRHCFLRSHTSTVLVCHHHLLPWSRGLPCHSPAGFPPSPCPSRPNPPSAPLYEEDKVKV